MSALDRKTAQGGPAWYSASELCGLPGLPSTRQGLHSRARAEKWRRRRRKGRGGGHEYHISSLPAVTRDYLLRRAAAEAAQQAQSALPDPIEGCESMAEMTDAQRRVMHARLAICSMIDEMAISHGIGRGAAIAAFMASAAAGELPDSTMQTLRTARARHGHGRLVDRATIYRWFRRRDAIGVAALAPSRRARQRHPAWLPRLLTLYQSPSKPSVAQCIQQWRRRWPNDPPPPLRTAQRHIAQLPEEIRQYGRMGRNARRAIQPFVRRTTDGLWPMDVVTVDGHLFKAYVRHPWTGRRFRPELTTYLDIATRRVVGFSAWLSESQYSIWIALREMVLDPRQGVPAVQYSDNGAYRGEQHRSTLHRIGTTLMYSQAYRAQARGVIERFNSSVWVPLAREMPTYCGQDMDKEALRRALRRADRESDNLADWNEFLDACRRAIAEYHARPHRALGGRSPDQAWADALADGWEPTVLEDDDLHDLLPSERRRVRRGEITLPWGRYYADDLTLHHGRDVVVHYDPMDGLRVWVTDDRGALICMAERDANSRPYLPASQLDHARAQRAAGRLRRLERRAAQVREEQAGVIELYPHTEVDPQIHAETVALCDDEPAQITDERRLHAYWLRVRQRIESGEPVSDEDRDGCRIYFASPEARSIDEFFNEFGLTADDFI